MSQLDVLTPKQVAKLFGVHYQTVLDWIHTGALQASLINERFYVRREWIDEMLERTSNRQQRPA
ncbi:MAG TPA: helix-turn-helix domain-containing protein [Nonomuraea sp.]|nr:helix-turn-helix domain-containing protein [Nonomuraea sp.]